jgi:hypothetical protein
VPPDTLGAALEAIEGLIGGAQARSAQLLLARVLGK